MKVRKNKQFDSMIKLKKTRNLIDDSDNESSNFSDNNNCHRNLIKVRSIYHTPKFMPQQNPSKLELDLKKFVESYEQIIKNEEDEAEQFMNLNI